MAANPANVSYITLNVEGINRDVVVPSGLTLDQLLRSEHISYNLIPFTADGDKLPGALVIGREIRNGSLVLLQPPTFQHSADLSSLEGKEKDPRTEFSPVVSWVGVIIGSVLSFLVYLTPVFQPFLTSLLASLIMLALAAGYALRPTLGKPVSELMAALSCSVAAGILSTASNPDDARYQAFICAFAAMGMISTLRWVVRGGEDPATARICCDTLMLGLGASVVGLSAFLAGIDIRLILAALFGVVAPTLQALPGFSVNIPTAQLIDEATIVREASSVRGPRITHAPLASQQEAQQLVKVGQARQILWTIYLCLAALVALPTVISYTQQQTWEAKVALGAIFLVVLAMILVPRGAASLHVRLIPRFCASLMILGYVAVFSHPSSLLLACFSSAAAFAFLASSFPVSRGFKPLVFTRIADISQSVCCTFSLPLALIGAQIITLVRTGGLL